MKKLLILLIFPIMGLISCERKPDCEKNNFGTVTIQNDTDKEVWVDCTREGQDVNEKRLLGVSKSTEYKIVPGGINLLYLEGYDYPDGEWHDKAIQLEQCAELPLLLSQENVQDSCEKYDFGTVIVTNHTSMVIWVDCTQEGQSLNEERKLDIDQSTIYYMKPGTVTEWAIEAWDYPDGAWYIDTYNLEQCDVHSDPWITVKGSSVSDLGRAKIKPDRKAKR